MGLGLWFDFGFLADLRLGSTNLGHAFGFGPVHSFQFHAWEGSQVFQNCDVAAGTRVGVRVRVRVRFSVSVRVMVRMWFRIGVWIEIV